MRLVAPLAVLAAAFRRAGGSRPPNVRIFGLDHREFAGAAMGVALLLSFLSAARDGAMSDSVLGFDRRSGRLVIVGLIGRLCVSGTTLQTSLAGSPENSCRKSRRSGRAAVSSSTRRLGGDFAVAARVNGARISLIFDTGASVVVLTGR